jgi:hypothetical protein
MGARLLLDGLSQGALCGPALADPVVKHASLQADFARPLADSLRLPAGSKHDVVSKVVLLLCWLGPAAICRGVIPVFVRPTVERVFGCGLQAHVGKEGGEVASPPLTNFDPAPTVSFVVVFLRVVAAVFHQSPTAVFGRARAPVLSGPLAAESRSLGAETATRLGVAGSQILALDSRCAAAFASASPHRSLAAAALRKPNDRQAGECLSSQINHLWHAGNILRLPVLAIGEL